MEVYLDGRPCRKVLMDALHRMNYDELFMKTFFLVRKCEWFFIFSFRKDFAINPGINYVRIAIPYTLFRSGSEMAYTRLTQSLYDILQRLLHWVCILKHL
jgi:hypothetical protein